MQVFRHVEANDSPEHARCNNLAFLQNGTPYHLSIYRYILEPFTKLIFLVEYPLMKQNKPGCCNTNALSDFSASLDLVQKFVQTEKDLPLKVGFTFTLKTASKRTSRLLVRSPEFLKSRNSCLNLSKSCLILLKDLRLVLKFNPTLLPLSKLCDFQLLLILEKFLQIIHSILFNLKKSFQ
jgi:hypothetical protein